MIKTYFKSQEGGMYYRLKFWKQSSYMEGVVMWKVAFTCSTNRVQANAWTSCKNLSPLEGQISGNGSARGLIWAQARIEEFLESVGPRNWLAVTGSDLRRVKAYRRLTRRGFQEGVWRSWDERGTPPKEEPCLWGQGRRGT